MCNTVKFWLSDLSRSSCNIYSSNLIWPMENLRPLSSSPYCISWCRGTMRACFFILQHINLIYILCAVGSFQPFDLQPWKSCVGQCSEIMHGNCFIFYGHIHLTWDMCNEGHVSLNLWPLTLKFCLQTFVRPSQKVIQCQCYICTVTLTFVNYVINLLFYPSPL